ELGGVRPAGEAPGAVRDHHDQGVVVLEGGEVVLARARGGRRARYPLETAPSATTTTRAPPRSTAARRSSPGSRGRRTTLVSGSLRSVRPARCRPSGSGHRRRYSRWRAGDASAVRRTTASGGSATAPSPSCAQPCAPTASTTSIAGQVRQGGGTLRR